MFETDKKVKECNKKKICKKVKNKILNFLSQNKQVDSININDRQIKTFIVICSWLLSVEMRKKREQKIWGKSLSNFFQSFCSVGI